MVGTNSGGEKWKWISRISLTSLSAAVAETATFPVDIIKTRLQLHGGDYLRHQTLGAGLVFRIATDIWRTTGVLGFYDGLAPAILRHLFYTPIRIVCYENLRSLPGDSVTWRAFSGGVSGALAQILASPADLIKVRMQADGCLVNQGLPARYAGLIDAFNKIIRREGISGLWRRYS
ncbi:hypothetical protein HPP92_027949 [Vanilla planifolia]|uniref:Uncharacterized protein n=1 Tax=Vanilla planifolia TaxID=51239 RepID=A0A835PD39_VANPL|nr:hypothetical protein HPP92_027949 [Vanilla planifolia]